MALKLNKVAFCKEEEFDFISVLRQRVNRHFKDKDLSTKANFSMYLKSLFLISLVGLSYTAILFSIGGAIGVVSLYFLMGFFVAVCTMNIAHDALHGAYVSHSFGNRLLGFTMDLFGASSFYWKKEHVVDHHTFTNIAEHDADLDVPIVLRLCPKAPHRSFHRFQHLYAPLLYCLNFMHWIYFSDFKRLYLIFRNKHSSQKKPSASEIFFLFFFKCLHVSLFLILPIVMLPLPWWVIVLGYAGLLATVGLTSTIIFQLAHIIEHVDFPLPNEEGKMENSFAKHQLATTANFATHNKWVCFLFGGLNFQIEHHLFPHICHMHLHKISPIVKSTAQEFGLPYHQNTSFFSAIRSHFKTLKKLGRSP